MVNKLSEGSGWVEKGVDKNKEERRRRIIWKREGGETVRAGAILFLDQSNQVLSNLLEKEDSSTLNILRVFPSLKKNNK